MEILQRAVPTRPYVPLNPRHERLITDSGREAYFEALQKTAEHLFRLDPKTQSIGRVTSPEDLIASSFSLTHDGRTVAFAASSPTSLREVFVSAVTPFEPVTLTRMTDQVSDLVLGSREVISWKSQDGTVIEGVLVKPADFDPQKKYPLLGPLPASPRS